MKKILIFCCLMLGACAPKMQGDIFSDANVRQKMANIKEACIESAAKEKRPNTVAVNCRFSAYVTLLKKAGFEDWDFFESERLKYLDISDQLDSKKITPYRADVLYNEADQEFLSAIAQRDSAKRQQYAAAMNALGNSLQTYSNDITPPRPVTCNSTVSPYGTTATTNCY